jgi:putative membrane protein
MGILSVIFIVGVAIEHLYFLYLEMFLWTRPKGIKTFGLKSKEFAEETKVLAANQGLYNGFLAGGLIYSLALKDTRLAIFFLACVIIAGVYGAYSTSKIRLFYMQSIPAIIAVILILINY